MENVEFVIFAEVAGEVAVIVYFTAAVEVGIFADVVGYFDAAENVFSDMDELLVSGVAEYDVDGVQSIA